VQMLSAFGPEHQVFFAMSISHWALNLWEDWQTRKFLGQGLSGDDGGGLALFPLNLLCGPHQIMLVMYFLHHTMTILAYSYSLATHQMGGVMVQGLMFEMPVLLMLRRELGVACDPLPRWLTHEESVNAHWLLTYALFIIGRGTSLALWFFSVLPGYGSERLAEELRPGDVVLYHCFAVFFTTINVRIVGLFFCWHGQDWRRAQDLFKAGNAAVKSERTADPEVLG